MCFPNHSLQGKDCELCDCGKNGKCIFTETFSEKTRGIQYEKKCVCDTGYADRYGTCTECLCGVNSKCEFEDGEKNCYCMDGYAELNGVCTECNCGEGGYCEFHSWEKICTCYNGFLFDGNICREGCYGNDDCEDNQKCVQESDDWKICQCADGLSGSNCDIKEWCGYDGKFANCRGVNGTCEYIKETRSINCICPYYKKLHPEENRCREICSDGFVCHNGGVCEERDGLSFCSCKSGLIGDRCETVFDCTPDGRYKGCEMSGGACSYNGSEVTCQCPGNRKFNDETLICEDCDCGKQGSCRFVDGKKKCNCTRGFVEESGTCREGCYGNDDCEDNQKCVQESDYWRICQCADGLSGDNCDIEEWCGYGGKFATCKGMNGTCVYNKEKRSIDCICSQYKELHPKENRCRETCSSGFECYHGGECEKIGGNKFCSCKPGFLGDWCETVYDCTHGKYKGCVRSGGACSYDGYTAKCECSPGNKVFNNKTLTCEECDCGAQGTCTFVDGTKTCSCNKGFVDKAGTCTEGCYEDDDCEDNQKCAVESYDWKICRCADGLSGRYCDVNEWCEYYGKFKYCRDQNGTCEYIKEKRSIDCTCRSGTKLHLRENRCKDVCTKDADCQNGGICEDAFCTCKEGLFGDKCENIFDCTEEGKFKGCMGSKGICFHDGRGAVCKCPLNEQYHDKEHTCKECDCGSMGSCRFENGRKKCDCLSGFAVKDGLCSATCSKNDDCEDYQACMEINGWMTCVCADGLSGANCEYNDWCKSDGKFGNCKGVNGTCEYVRHKRSVECTCADGKALHPTENRCRDVCIKDTDCQNGGICEDAFCTCKAGLFGDKCENIFDCTKEGKFRGCMGSKGICFHDGGRAVCKCPLNEQYHDTEHTCKECDCGSKGSCRFENGLKKCDCFSGFAVKDGICTATCSKNDDCEDYEACIEKNGWMTCVCADGLSGADCERKYWCEDNGKFKNCKDTNGTCEYVKDKRSVECTCDDGKALHPTENRCRETCSSSDDCMIGGTCVRNFCSCKPGLFGDKCETVFDCTPEGKYKDCESSGGKCYYDGYNSICECTENKILHDKELICKDCHCGDHGSCAFKYEEKVCLCDKGYSEKNGKCESCDCGENGYCAFEGDEKVCKCDVSYSENKGKCESCDCGKGGWCSFINGEKTCECGSGYSEKDGICENCDCGIHGLCYFVGGEKLCKCEAGYAEKNGRCEVCSCGKNTVCQFIYGAKACLCIEGYTFNDVTGECERCDCGFHGTCAFLDGKKTCMCKRGFSEDLGECKECDCGEGAVNCSFVGGQKQCSCRIGFSEKNGQCKRLQSCEPNPCVNGHCVMRENNFLCVCDNPFTGRYCEISSCIETNCLGGRCRVVGKREECECPVGHKLANGTCTKTFCVEKKCYDGECVIENGVETCICPDGYVSDGNECRKVKCSERSCIGGSCRIIRGNIEDCVCPIGHVLIGDTCTITTCTPRTCYGGRCEKRDGELVCICPDGFHLEGVGCIETTCKEQNCFGGKCRVINGKEICTCLDGHVLKNDQCQKVRCVEKHCFGGKCDVVDGEEVCSCPVGFEVQGDVCREI